MKNQLEPFDLVKVLENSFSIKEGISGEIGIIQTDGSPYEGETIWGVYIDQKEEMYMLKDSQIKPLGISVSEEEFYDGTWIKVAVDPDTGEGEIVD